QKVTLGPVSQNQPIKLAGYDPRWPQLFQKERAKIEQALGKTALKIEHVGSTAIPGLSAKPIIDILLVVPQPADERAYVSQLEAAGYVLRIREPDEEEHRMFIGSQRQLHIHVYGPASREACDLVLFRDWLRANEPDRVKYQELKKQLAAKSWRTVQDYADAKGPLVAEIKARAQGASANKK
ncbi:GrpB family protein, partial [Lactobacillus sp. XV13L]|nr:GrpB family protein [Lactobacillus sp. XV13L]